MLDPVATLTIAAALYVVTGLIFTSKLIADAQRYDADFAAVTACPSLSARLARIITTVTFVLLWPIMLAIGTLWPPGRP